MELQQEYEQVVRRLRKQFVLELLRFKTLYWSTAEEINDYYHLNFIDDAMTLIVIKCFARTGNYNDVSTIMTLVEQYMYEFLSPWFHEFETAHDNTYVVGVYDILGDPLSDEVKLFKAAIDSFFNYIHTDIAFQNYDFVMGTGKVVFRISDLPKCLDSALYAVNSSIIYGVNQPYDSNLMDTPEGNIAQLVTPARKQRLMHSIETLDPGSLADTIREIFLSNREYYMLHPNIAYRVANAILSVCVSVVSDNIGAQYYTEKRAADAIVSFSRCPNVSALCRACIEVVDDIYNTYRNHLEHSNQLPIANAMQYIRRNYQKRLRLSDIARHIGFSPQYLSVQFKSQAGLSLTQYITNTRIEAAKALLSQTTVSITRLAEMVGFDDPKYFSRTFHAAVGVSPREWRRTNGVMKVTEVKLPGDGETKTEK